MTGLIDGTTVPWHLVSGKHEPEIVRPQLPPPVRREPAPIPPEVRAAITEVVRRQQTAVLEQTRLIARMGMAAKDLGHAIADNLRRLNTQEEPHP